jgi:hypothetical protein
MGALAIGKMAIGQLVLGRAMLRRGQIEELMIARLTIKRTDGGTCAVRYAGSGISADSERLHRVHDPKTRRTA